MGLEDSTHPTFKRAIALTLSPVNETMGPGKSKGGSARSAFREPRPNARPAEELPPASESMACCRDRSTLTECHQRTVCMLQ